MRLKLLLFTVVELEEKFKDIPIDKNGQTIKLSSAWVCFGVIQDTQWEVTEDLERTPICWISL